MAEQRTLDAERARAIAEEDAYPHPGDNPHASVHTRYTDRSLAFRTGWAAALAYVAKADVARCAPPALDAEGLPELPEPFCKVGTGASGMWAERSADGGEPVYTAEQVRQAQRDAVAADRRARRPIVRTTLSPEMKAALEEAFKTRSTAALLPGGSPVFINYGDQPEDTAPLSCTACGGSGHIDDQEQIARQSAPEGAPVGMVPIYQAFLGTEGWIDIEEREVAGYQSSYFKTRALYAPTSASAQPADQNKMENNDE